MVMPMPNPPVVNNVVPPPKDKVEVELKDMFLLEFIILKQI